MAKRTKKAKSVGRFGARYGVRIRRRIREVEVRQHAEHSCPACGAPRVQRESTGIWLCKKCGHKFAGGAYVPETRAAKSAEMAQVLETDGGETPQLPEE
jgi:large subunit ribosomal protein L37Ae